MDSEEIAARSRKYGDGLAQYGLERWLATRPTLEDDFERTTSISFAEAEPAEPAQRSSVRLHALARIRVLLLALLLLDVCAAENALRHQGIMATTKNADVFRVVRSSKGARVAVFELEKCA